MYKRQVFGAKTEVALDLLHIADLAWHDCYREVAPSEEIVGDLLLLSGGTIDGLVDATLLALTDWRDLKLAAQAQRERRG